MDWIRQMNFKGNTYLFLFRWNWVLNTLRISVCYSKKIQGCDGMLISCLTFADKVSIQSYTHLCLLILRAQTNLEKRQIQNNRHTFIYDKTFQTKSVPYVSWAKQIYRVSRKIHELKLNSCVICKRYIFFYSIPTLI